MTIFIDPSDFLVTEMYAEHIETILDIIDFKSVYQEMQDRGVLTGLQ